ncbi:PA2169 family four-helix-bundle protein [Sulfitobacter sp. S190]|uniref:PA2169 family four-helix-bundle protein n=1 Tax=Sulfitobacter sp. S190 TaxID=2867022 RepID=UPI0021A5320F|nr:PA2169 family four-helix-bundle protein [Sulfitobacter sp. S190]UWR21255.1 PA2169 family four-helix-bundle protein [Sulfitobacter sp. S190]
MKDEAEALSDLHTTFVDSRDGYEQAAGLIHSARLTSFFDEMQSNRATQADEVRSFLRGVDVDLSKDGTLFAAAHRHFLTLRDFASSDDEDVVEDIIREERKVLENYDEAIRPMNGDSDAYRFAQTQYEALAKRVEKLEKEERRLDRPS